MKMFDMCDAPGAYSPRASGGARMRKRLVIGSLLVSMMLGAVGTALALSRERWTDTQPYGFFFNDYGPNFYVGFVPREQDHRRITIHLGRGNQIRLRIVL